MQITTERDRLGFIGASVPFFTPALPISVTVTPTPTRSVTRTVDAKPPTASLPAVVQQTASLALPPLRLSVAPACYLRNKQLVTEVDANRVGAPDVTVQNLPGATPGPGVALTGIAVSSATATFDTGAATGRCRGGTNPCSFTIPARATVLKSIHIVIQLGNQPTTFDWVVNQSVQSPG